MRKKINPEETVSISFEFILTIQQKAAKKMKKADFLSLLTAFAASSFHEGASLQGHKGPIPEGAGIVQR